MIKEIEVAFVSSYVPRKCGIATFTKDLADSISDLDGGEAGIGSITVTALNDIAEGYKYPSEVNFEIRDKSINGYKEAAQYLNLSSANVVNVQHEFGLYGGEGGSNILYFFEKLRKPVVTTLHTVLEEPSKEEYKVLKEIARRSVYLVVQSAHSHEVLQDIMKIPSSKIKLIPHGAHDVPFMDPAFYKDKFNLSEKKVLLTFGLLGPGKGHEDVINALPGIIENYPDVMYIILGATHPNVIRHSGESYRNSLENIVKKNGLENNVMFINKFVTTKELLEYLLMSDIYVSPYRNKAQAVSGTLTYAVACGKAVVATPYRHAEELLKNERGIVVPFSDPSSMSKAISDLLLDENKRNRLRKNAYTEGRKMTWENVARKYSKVFLSAVRNFRTYTSLPVQSITNELPLLPEVNLTHLKRLTDCTGIFQHATYSIPNPHHGYCTDDNVRALLVAFMHKAYFNDNETDHLINIYLTFVFHSYNEENGLFRNFMSYDRKWLEEKGTEDCNGRVIFVLGYLIKNSDSNSIIGLAKNLFDKSVKNMKNFRSPRAIAYIMLGCIFYLNKFSGASEIKNILNTMSYFLFELYVNVRTDDWKWFENILTYVNARLPQAMLMAGDFLDNEKYKEAGIESLEWYYNVLQEQESNNVSLIGNDGWLEKGKSKTKFDQQPIEIPPLIDACYQAFLITGDDTWVKRIGTSFSWFLGNNDRQEPLVDFTSGGCYDGLTPISVNENQGAESTISWLLSLHRMIIISHQLQLNDEKGKEKLSEELV